MAIVENRQYEPINIESDPDDYRPNSSMALVIDPANDQGDFVKGMTVLFERMAPGDRIPLHTHTIEEVIFIDEGAAEVTVGEERRTVGPGAVVFVPIGKPHGTRNVGDSEVRLHAVFPSQMLSIHYLERNPAPGTEGDAPQPPIVYDVRTLMEGDPSVAIQPQ
jgi:quercetin dioxygenase-like cupin family protein